MRCAVTGANGFLGSHLVERLVAEGHDVRLLVRPGADRRWISAVHATVVEGGLDDGAALRRTFAECEVVFHVAGTTSATSASIYYRVNAEGTRRAAEACLAAAPAARRFVLVSSLAAMGPGIGAQPVDERSLPRPNNDYGRSKLRAELEARAFGPRLPLAVVRPGAIYGPRDRDVLILLWLAAHGIRLRLGSKRRVLNFCHVADVVSALLLAATRGEALGQSYLIGDTRNYTLDEAGAIMVDALRGGRGLTLRLPPALLYLAGVAGEALSRFAGTRPVLTRDRARLLTQSNWGMSVALAQEQLGYSPRYDLAAGVAQTVAWCRRVGWM